MTTAMLGVVHVDTFGPRLLVFAVWPSHITVCASPWMKLWAMGMLGVPYSLMKIAVIGLN